MKVVLSTTNFKANYDRGRKEFNKLSQTEQVTLVGVERARQHYNKTHTPILPAQNTDLGVYLKRKVSLQNALKEALKKFKL